MEGKRLTRDNRKICQKFRILNIIEIHQTLNRQINNKNLSLKKLHWALK